MMVGSMAITYEFDIAPHLRRAHALRFRRLERLAYLRRHDGRAVFWQLALPACLLFWAAIACGTYALL